MIQALRSGILIVNYSVITGVGWFFVIHRRRNQVGRSDYPGQSGQGW
jgi:hypothetical protein